MICTAYKGSFKSADGIHNAAYYVRFPAYLKPIGIIQVSHGMCERFQRYSKFADYLNSYGYIVCGMDDLGHGATAGNTDDLGFFAETKGWEKVLADMHTLMKIMQANYPELPYFMIGHSMGSLLARAFTIKYGKKLKGAVYIGTCDDVPAVPFFLSIIDTVTLFTSSRHRSRLINGAAVIYCNHRIHGRKTKFSWTTRDEKIARKALNDPFYNYMFTMNGFENLARLFLYVSDDRWYAAYPKELPTLFLSGSDDPVGRYGKGVRYAAEKLAEQGCNISGIIYNGARHELINEINCEEVYRDILGFISKLNTNSR